MASHQSIHRMFKYKQIEYTVSLSKLLQRVIYLYYDFCDILKEISKFGEIFSLSMLICYYFWFPILGWLASCSWAFKDYQPSLLNDISCLPWYIVQQTQLTFSHKPEEGALRICFHDSYFQIRTEFFTYPFVPPWGRGENWTKPNLSSLFHHYSCPL